MANKNTNVITTRHTGRKYQLKQLYYNLTVALLRNPPKYSDRRGLSRNRDFVQLQVG